MLKSGDVGPEPYAQGGSFTVAEWIVDVRALEIANGHKRRRLEPKVMELLVCLARRSGEAITREELHEAVWPGVHVGYDSLTTAVIKLRKAFGDDPRHPNIVKTIPKVGYRLIAQVEFGRQDGLSPQQEQTDHRSSPNERSLASTTATPARPPKPATRWLAVGAAALALLLVVGGAVWWKPWAPEIVSARAERMRHPLPGKPSIAVLAFKNLSEDSKHKLLSDAVAENIITELSRFSELFVIARGSSFSYKGKPLRIHRVAEELGVRYVVSGTFQRNGNRLRVTVQLIDAISGTYLWAERFDRDIENVFDLQDEIARAIVATVASKIHRKERENASRRRPSDLVAYEYYLRGEHEIFRWTEDANERARKFFEKAIKLDPKLARGYVGLAGVYLNYYRWSYGDIPRDKALRLALATARKARQLDPFDSKTHRALAYIHMRSKNLKEAEAGFEAARKINPNAVDVLGNIAEMRNYQGRYQEAIELMKRAMRLNPHHPDWYYWVLADAQWLAGKSEDALRSMNRVSDIHSIKPATRSLAIIYVQLGRFDEARAVMAKYLKNDPDFTLTSYKKYLQTLPWKDPGIIDRRVVPTMRKAGVPE